MGNLVPQVQQRLFADHLRHNQAFRLIGHHVIREILGTLGQLGSHGLGQLLQAVAGLGADGDDGVIAAISEGGDQRQQLLRLQQIDLVQQQHLRHLLAGHILHNGTVVLAHLSRIYQHHHAVHAVHRFTDRLHHVVTQLGAGRVNTGGIQEYHLPVIAGHHAHDTVSGSLGTVGHDGNLLAHQGIHQGGLTHVGTANNGHKTGTELLYFIHLR